MKYLILTLILFSQSAFAVKFEIKELCKNSSYYADNISIEEETTVGHLTIQILENLELSYQGNENGIAGLLNTPVGMDGYEVLADNHMRAYGWCFSVNGVEPNILASEYILNKNSTDTISWYYGYAELINDEWISYCTPTYKHPTSFVCKNNYLEQ